MKTYTFKILAVKIGSIGKRQKFTLTVEAENFQNAQYKLYDTHEHIHILSVNGIKPDKQYNLVLLAKQVDENKFFTILESDYLKKPDSYKGIYSSDNVHGTKLNGKRTLLYWDREGGTCLLIEGLSLKIVKNKSQNFNPIQ